MAGSLLITGDNVQPAGEARQVWTCLQYQFGSEVRLSLRDSDMTKITVKILRWKIINKTSA